jgi:hypothetical protein
MAILVASSAAQLSVLLVPELMPVGSAVKEVMVGTEPFPGGALDEVAAPQPARAAQANRTRASEQRSGPEEWSPGKLRFLEAESVESIRDPKQIQSIAHRAPAVALGGPSPLGPPALCVHRVLGVIRRSTVEMTVEGAIPVPVIHLRYWERFGCQKQELLLPTLRGVPAGAGQLICPRPGPPAPPVWVAFSESRPSETNQ